MSETAPKLAESPEKLGISETLKLCRDRADDLMKALGLPTQEAAFLDERDLGYGLRHGRLPRVWEGAESEQIKGFEPLTAAERSNDERAQNEDRAIYKIMDRVLRDGHPAGEDECKRLLRKLNDMQKQRLMEITLREQSRYVHDFLLQRLLPSELFLLTRDKGPEGLYTKAEMVGNFENMGLIYRGHVHELPNELLITITILTGETIPKSLKSIVFDCITSEMYGLLQTSGSVANREKLTEEACIKILERIGFSKANCREAIDCAKPVIASSAQDATARSAIFSKIGDTNVEHRRKALAALVRLSGIQDAERLLNMLCGCENGTVRNAGMYFLPLRLLSWLEKRLKYSGDKGNIIADFRQNVAEPNEAQAKALQIIAFAEQRKWMTVYEAVCHASVLESDPEVESVLNDGNELSEEEKWDMYRHMHMSKKILDTFETEEQRHAHKRNFWIFFEALRRHPGGLKKVMADRALRHTAFTNLYTLHAGMCGEEFVVARDLSLYLEVLAAVARYDSDRAHDFLCRFIDRRKNHEHVRIQISSGKYNREIAGILYAPLLYPKPDTAVWREGWDRIAETTIHPEDEEVQVAFHSDSFRPDIRSVTWETAELLDRVRAMGRNCDPELWRAEVPGTVRLVEALQGRINRLMTLYPAPLQKQDIAGALRRRVHAVADTVTGTEPATDEERHALESAARCCEILLRITHRSFKARKPAKIQPEPGDSDYQSKMAESIVGTIFGEDESLEDSLEKAGLLKPRQPGLSFVMEQVKQNELRQGFADFERRLPLPDAREYRALHSKNRFEPVKKAIQKWARKSLYTVLVLGAAAGAAYGVKKVVERMNNVAMSALSGKKDSNVIGKGGGEVAAGTPDTAESAPVVIGRLSEKLEGNDQYLITGFVHQDAEDPLTFIRKASLHEGSCGPPPEKLKGPVTLTLHKTERKFMAPLPLNAVLKSAADAYFKNGEWKGGWPTIRGDGMQGLDDGDKRIKREIHNFSEGEIDIPFMLGPQPEIDENISIRQLQTAGRITKDDRGGILTGEKLGAKTELSMFPQELQKAVLEARAMSAWKAALHVQAAVRKFMRYTTKEQAPYAALSKNTIPKERQPGGHALLHRICELRQGDCKQYSRLLAELLRHTGIDCMEITCIFAQEQEITTKNFHIAPLVGILDKTHRSVSIVLEATSGQQQEEEANRPQWPEYEYREMSPNEHDVTLLLIALGLHIVGRALAPHLRDVGQRLLKRMKRRTKEKVLPQEKPAVESEKEKPLPVLGQPEVIADSPVVVDGADRPQSAHVQMTEEKQEILVLPPFEQWWPTLVQTAYMLSCKKCNEDDPRQQKALRGEVEVARHPDMSVCLFYFDVRLTLRAILEKEEKRLPENYKFRADAALWAAEQYLDRNPGFMRLTTPEGKDDKLLEETEKKFRE